MNLKALLTTVVVFAAGCTAKGPTTPQQEPRFPEYLEHRVEYSGETLGSIARWYTGASANWSKIQAANPDIRPNKIRVGMLIRIPNELITRTEKMPAPVRADRATDRVSPPSPEQAAPETIETSSVVTAPPADEEAATTNPLPPTTEVSLPDAPPPVQEVAELPSTNGAADSQVNAPSELDQGSLGNDSSGSVGSFLGALGKALAPSRGSSSSGTP